MRHLSLDKTKKYLLACSFGPDSMALFFLLLKEKYDFEVAIVNYHLRKESDDEVENLKNFCHQNNKIIHVLDVKEKITSNIEEKCREIRYNFFASICNKNKLSGVIVAHHQDDSIETYFLQKQRQILPIFYGLQEKTTILGIDIYRPLLAYTKTDLAKICTENSIPFSIDKSNLSDKYLRNKIRHTIIDKLDEKERRKILGKIKLENKKLSSILSSIDLSKVGKVSYLLSLKGVSFNYAINFFLSNNGIRSNIGKKQCEEVRKILLSDKPNITFKINKDITLVKEYDQIKVSNEKINYSYYIKEPIELDTDYFYINLKSFDKIAINLDQYPLTIRNIDKNDTYLIKDYLVSARRLMIDWKMPVSLRNMWPVIVNNNNQVIYIPRYQSSYIRKKNECFYVKTN
ncbi:MAG: tRNA lysidine(34) synthetase TilS [Bacilli bacterium]|nr:tRNA lysidine(34) synthetase TilS [Bacilli bacterium]